MTVDDPGLARFNTLAGDEAEAMLHACCAAAAWTGAIGNVVVEKVAATLAMSEAGR